MTQHTLSLQTRKALIQSYITNGEIEAESSLQQLSPLLENDSSVAEIHPLFKKNRQPLLLKNFSSASTIPAFVYSRHKKLCNPATLQDVSHTSVNHDQAKTLNSPNFLDNSPKKS